MDTEIFFIAEVRENGVRHTPVSHLEGIAVLNNSGDILSNPLGDIIRHISDEFKNLLFVGNDKIDIVNADKGIPVDTGHV